MSSSLSVSTSECIETFYVTVAPEEPASTIISEPTSQMPAATTSLSQPPPPPATTTTSPVEQVNGASSVSNIQIGSSIVAISFIALLI